MWLSRRTLLHERTQVLLTLLAIGLSVMLVVVLLGVLTGVRRQTADYLTQIPGSVVVAAAGTESFLMVAVPLPAGTETRVRAMPDVAGVVPLLSQMVVLDLHDRREATFVIGYEPSRGGGPRRIVSGKAPERESDIVLGRPLAERHGVKAGESITILGRDFTVTGLADDPSPLMTSFVYIAKPTLEQLMLTPGASSILIVTPQPGVSAETLREQLATLPGVGVVLKPQVIANDIALFTGPIQPVIRLMAGIALLAGTLVVGLLIYTATIQRQREYGVLKAVGVRNAALYRMIAGQALITAVTGVALGLLLAIVIARLIMTLRPEFLISLTFGAALLAAGTGVLMALVAAVAPTRVIARLAPADVFRR